MLYKKFFLMVETSIGQSYSSEIMKAILFLAVVSLVASLSEGLKCRSENDARTIEEYEDIVRSCLYSDDSDNKNNNNNNGNRRRINGNNNNNNNNNRNNNWGNRDQKNQNNRGRYGEYDDGDDFDGRDDQNKRGNGNDQGRKKQQQRDKYNSEEEEEDYQDDKWSDQNSKNKPSQKGNNSRDRTYFSQRGQKDNKSQGNQRNGQKQDDSSGYQNFFNSGNNTNKQSFGSPLDNVEPCIIHCMFRQLKMVNSNSYLDKSNIINILTKRIKDPELKEFIQDSVHECFETIEDNGKCESTKSFAMCLEEKGKSNCEDWDPNMKQGKRNNGKNNNNNNNQGNTFQSSPPRG